MLPSDPTAPRFPRFADCLGETVNGEPHVIHYVGGDLNIPCGAIIDADLVVAGSWTDPNNCPVEDNHHTLGHGRRFVPAVQGSGVVVSESAVASAVGAKVLAQGGNAMDAAVATVFAAGVARPEQGGIGGNGHLVYRSATGETAALDFEAVAPAAATPDMFAEPGVLGGPGAMPGWTGHRVVGVPGVVAGMSAALDRFGTITLKQAVAPAVELAEGGVLVTPELADDYFGPPFLDRTVDVPAKGLPGAPTSVNVSDAALPVYPTGPRVNHVRLSLFPEAARIYLRNGRPYIPQERLVQTDYANSLKLIGDYGPAAFYDASDPHGSIARAIVADMDHSRQAPVAPGDEGLMTAEDLKAYRAVWRTPVRTTYRGVEVIAPPPPDAGPIAVLESLNILEGFDLGKLGFGSADYWHLMAEVQKLVTADAYAYVNDPAVADVPTAELVSKRFAAQRRALIDMRTAATDVRPGTISGHPPATSMPDPRPAQTDTVSVIDKRGNAVAVTFSLNEHFGSAVVPAGAGFLLNSNLDAAPVGSPQEVRGGKHEISPITPTIVVRAGRPILALGGVGGLFIPEGVLDVITDVLDFGQDLATAVDAPRSQEFTCCTLVLEDWRTPQSVLDDLTARGHNLSGVGEYWGVPLIEAASSLERGRAGAVADPRNEPDSAVPAP